MRAREFDFCKNMVNILFPKVTQSPEHNVQRSMTFTDIVPRVTVHYGIPSTASILAFDPIQHLLATGTLQTYYCEDTTVGTHDAIQVLDQVFPKKERKKKFGGITSLLPHMNKAKIHQNRSSLLGELLLRTNELCFRSLYKVVPADLEMGVKAVDFWSVIWQKNDWMTTCYRDGVHLSIEGSEIVVQGNV